MDIQLDWREREDANILKMAKEIVSDSERHEKAVRAAKILAIKQEEELKALKSVVSAHGIDSKSVGTNNLLSQKLRQGLKNI